MVGQKPRRAFLKTIGAGIGAISGASVATAASGDRFDDWTEIYEEALRIKSKTGSVSEFRKFLAENGLSVAKSDISRELPSNSDGFSTQQYDKSEWHGYLSITQQCDSSGPIEKYGVDFSWSFDDTYGNEFPADVAGLAWSGDDWALRNDEYYSSSPVEYGYSNGHGIAWTYDESINPTNLQSCGGYFYPDSTSPPGNRQMFADYWHTFQSVDYSITISSGGVGLNANPVTDVVHWDRDEDNNRLVVSQADAEVGCGI